MVQELNSLNASAAAAKRSTDNSICRRGSAAQLPLRPKKSTDLAEILASGREGKVMENRTAAKSIAVDGCSAQAY